MKTTTYLSETYNDFDNKAEEYAPNEQELQRRKSIADAYNAKHNEAHKVAQERNQEIAVKREATLREQDIADYMRFYPVSREHAESNLDWFRSQGRNQIQKQMFDFSRSIF